MKRISLCFSMIIFLFLNTIFGSDKPVITLESNNELQKAKQKVKEFYSGLVIEVPGEKEMIVETVSHDNALSRKLTDSFKKIRDGMPKFACFYDYYDVLATIDGSIALTFELINTVTGNYKSNAKNCERVKKEVEMNLEKFSKLVIEVNKLVSKKQDSLPENLKDVKNECCEFKQNITLLEGDDIKYYKNFCVKIYQCDVNSKVDEIKNLRKDLENLKKEICPLGDKKAGCCPLNEDDIKNNPDLFNKLKLIASEIHDRLLKCQEKETNKLSFLFKFYDGILRILSEYNTKLEGYEKELGGL